MKMGVSHPANSAYQINGHHELDFEAHKYRYFNSTSIN